MIRVFKFGGASVKDASAVKNVVKIIQNFGSTNQILVVVSAMGKTTNALEKLLNAYFENADWQTELENIKKYHWQIAEQLFSEGHIAFTTIEYLFLQLQDNLLNKTRQSYYDESYDQIVSFGELISSHILSHYLKENNVANEWIDAKNFIKTDTTWREGKVDLPWTENLVKRELEFILQEKIIVTQGFLGGTLGNKTTTLGREGSDYTASIFAYCLEAESLTIWKDVPGVLNADPKKVSNTQLYETLSYTEAAEMTFYGANVIHPKTIKPIANKNIPLLVRSFLEPDKSGTRITNTPSEKKVPTIIFKPNQILLTFGVKDLAFITEENLSKILHTFTQLNCKIHLMQSSAVSFSICTDYQIQKIKKIYEFLEDEFEITEQKSLQILTILYYDKNTLEEISSSFTKVLEQKTKTYYRAVIENKEEN
ncbi:MAG: aspartate kinase [Thermonemataceae bacterium]|nr:aspartate kinase [Thermonemataceae bacterium]